MKGFILSLFLLLYLSGLSFGEEVIVGPSRLKPGDPFVVVIKDPESRGRVPEYALLNKREFPFNKCGKRCYYTIGAVEMDEVPGDIRLIILFRDGRRTSLNLYIERTEFPEIRLELPEDKVFLSPKDKSRAEAEEKLLKDLWQKRTERLWRGEFIWPLRNEVSTGFGVRRIINRKKLSIHRGIDIKAREGEPIKAVNYGRVVLTKELFFGGRTIILDHGDGLYSVYMHLSDYLVKEGDLVSKGDVIGLAGATGRAKGAHLHFTFKVGDMSINPESLFRLKELSYIP